MSADLNLKDLILSWKNQYGSDYQHESGTMKVIPANSDQRKELLAHLINTLITVYNFKREDFTSSVKNQIVEACINTHSKKKVKRSEWRDYAGSDYDVVLIGFFQIKIEEAKKEQWHIEGKAVEEYIKPEIEKFANPENIDEIRKDIEKPKTSKIKPLDFTEIRKNTDNIVRDVEDEDFLNELEKLKNE